MNATGPNIGFCLTANVIVSALFVGGLGSWATLVPLLSASLGVGVLGVEGDRKTVQHFEGGIVAVIGAQDGDGVAAAQLLLPLPLDKTRAKSTLDLLRARSHGAQARTAHLLAERDNVYAIEFPEHLSSASATEKVAGIIAGERQIFATRQRALLSRTAILE